MKLLLKWLKQHLDIKRFRGVTEKGKCLCRHLLFASCYTI